MHDPDLVDPRFGSGQVQRLHHVDGLHRRPEHPGDDVARVVIQHRREVVPAPAHDLQVGEVGLPQLVRPMRRMPERLRGREHDVGRTRDQVVGLEDARSIPRETGPRGLSTARPAPAATARDPPARRRRRAGGPVAESGSSTGGPPRG